MKSFKPKSPSGDGPGSGSDAPPSAGERNAEAEFPGRAALERDPRLDHRLGRAGLYRKGEGKEAKLCFMSHVPMENRSGLLVGACLTRADGQAERVAALALIMAPGQAGSS